MAESTGEITDAQSAKIVPLLPKAPRSAKSGRKRLADRDVFDGTIWVLPGGARWRDLPEG